MKVILKNDIPNLGQAGEIKEVKNGYARNYLLPRGLVMTATARSEKERAFLEQVQRQKTVKRKKTAEEMSGQLAGAEVRITMKVGDEGRLFGSVTNMAIAKELEAAGFSVDKRSIQLDDPIKNLGEYQVKVRLHENITPHIKVFVQDEEGNTVWTPPVEEEAEAASEAEAAAESEAASEAEAAAEPEAAPEAEAAAEPEAAPEAEAAAEPEAAPEAEAAAEPEAASEAEAAAEPEAAPEKETPEQG